jgi:hypothetical protein
LKRKKRKLSIPWKKGMKIVEPLSKINKFCWIFPNNPAPSPSESRKPTELTANQRNILKTTRNKKCKRNETVTHFLQGLVVCTKTIHNFDLL